LCWADWKYEYHYVEDYDVSCCVRSYCHELLIDFLSMWHVLFHYLPDTPSHTPGHTRLLEYLPPCNRLWTIAFEKGTDDQYFHYHLLTGGQHYHREMSLQAKQLPRVRLCFWWQLVDVSRTIWETMITDDCDAR
jgi:hypothetical protein